MAYFTFCYFEHIDRAEITVCIQKCGNGPIIKSKYFWMQKENHWIYKKKTKIQFFIDIAFEWHLTSYD